MSDNRVLMNKEDLIELGDLIRNKTQSGKELSYESLIVALKNSITDSTVTQQIINIPETWGELEITNYSKLPYAGGTCNILKCSNNIDAYIYFDSNTIGLWHLNLKTNVITNIMETKGSWVLFESLSKVVYAAAGKNIYVLKEASIQNSFSTSYLITSFLQSTEDYVYAFSASDYWYKIDNTSCTEMPATGPWFSKLNTNPSSYFIASDKSIYFQGGYYSYKNIYRLKNGVMEALFSTTYYTDFKFFEASDGTVYIGNKGPDKLAKIKGDEVTIISESLAITSIVEDADGNIYVRANSSVVSMITDEGLQYVCESNILFRTSNKTIYITSGKEVRYIEKGVATTIFTSSTANVWSNYFESSKGEVYVGSSYTTNSAGTVCGILHLKGATAKQIFSSYSYKTFFEASDGTIYVGSNMSGAGIVAITESSARQIIFDASNFNSFFETDTGNVYVSGNSTITTTIGIYYLKGTTSKALVNKGSYPYFYPMSSNSCIACTTSIPTNSNNVCVYLEDNTSKLVLLSMNSISIAESLQEEY